MSNQSASQREPLLSRHLTIHGRVQGVGYRWSLRTQTLRRQLTGWVRNRLDGSVEAIVFGAPEAVEALTRWARQGPPAAQVDRIDITDSLVVHEHEMPMGFEQRPTC